MPEPITLVAGVSSVVSNVLGISKTLYEHIDGTINAPKHVTNVSKEVYGLFVALGTLQGLLDNLRTKGQIQQASALIFQTLQQPLDDCLQICVELLLKIKKHTKPTGAVRTSKWTGFWWQFTDKETNTYLSHVAAYKSTVIIALASANYANTTQTLHVNTNLEAEVQSLRAQIEALQDQDGSIINENGSQGTDRLFCLQRFMATTETVLSSPPASPTLSYGQSQDDNALASLPRLNANPSRIDRSHKPEHKTVDGSPPVTQSFLEPARRRRRRDSSALPETQQITTPSNLSSMPPVLMRYSEPRKTSLSHAAITQKAMEKLNNEERNPLHNIHSSGEKSRRQTRRKENTEEHSTTNGTENRSSDTVSSVRASPVNYEPVRSGVSNITNHKLFDTVEDAIQRLILPELREIRRNRLKAANVEVQFMQRSSENTPGVLQTTNHESPLTSDLTKDLLKHHEEDKETTERRRRANPPQRVRLRTNHTRARNTDAQSLPPPPQSDTLPIDNKELPPSPL